MEGQPKCGELAPARYIIYAPSFTTLAAPQVLTAKSSFFSLGDLFYNNNYPEGLLKKQVYHAHKDEHDKVTFEAFHKTLQSVAVIDLLITCLYCLLLSSCL